MKRTGCFTLIVFLLSHGILLLFLVEPFIGLWYMIVAFPGQSHLFLEVPRLVTV